MTVELTEIIQHYRIRYVRNNRDIHGNKFRCIDISFIFMGLNDATWSS